MTDSAKKIEEGAFQTHAISPPKPGSLVLSFQIRKQFFASQPKTRGFELDVCAEVGPGFTIVFGPSGAGKTTLLECIAGLIHPDSGRVSAGNKLFFDSTRKLTLDVARRRVGYVFQDLALFPHFTVEKNISYGLQHLAAAVRKTRVDEIVESFRIGGLGNRKPHEISGGERQRVALARTLVTDPCVLLLDEPLAALDEKTKSKIIEDLCTWNEAHEIPVLYVTHSREEVFALGNYVLRIEDGKIVAKGPAEDLGIM